MKTGKYCMRSVQSLFLVFFIIIYLIINFGTYISLLKLFKGQAKRYFKYFFITYSLLLILAFTYFYIYPNKPREASNYGFYFYFNAILFIDFFVKLPLFITGIIALFFKKKQIIKFSSLIIAAGVGFSMVYGLTVGNKSLKISHIELDFPDLPEGFNNYKIAQISDIHLGSFKKSNPLLKKVANEVKNIAPDLILFTGDLVNNFAYEIDGWEPVFNEITSNIQCYSILGNHDYGDYTRWNSENKKVENLKQVIDSHSKLGFHILRNQNVTLKSGNDSIFLIGVENWGHAPFPQYADLNKALENVPETGFKVLMSHDPAHWESRISGQREDIALTLSGHTHGLQMGFKPAGIPFSLSYLTRINWGGLYTDGKTFLYVNTGLGTVGIPWRIDMPAELTVITLKRSKIDGE